MGRRSQIFAPGPYVAAVEENPVTPLPFPSPHDAGDGNVYSKATAEGGAAMSAGIPAFIDQLSVHRRKVNA